MEKFPRELGRSGLRRVSGHVCKYEMDDRDGTLE